MSKAVVYGGVIMASNLAINDNLLNNAFISAVTVQKKKL